MVVHTKINRWATARLSGGFALSIAGLIKALEHFHELAGPSFYRRIDVHVERAAYPETKRRLLVDLAEAQPASLAGHHVARTDALSTEDGFKFFLDDGSWLLVRASGTEPLVRVYTEATTADLREDLLAAGEHLVRGG